MSGDNGKGKMSEIKDNRSEFKPRKDDKNTEPVKVKFRGILMQLMFDEVNESGEPIRSLPSDPKQILKGALESPLKEYINKAVEQTIVRSGFVEIE